MGYAEELQKKFLKDFECAQYCYGFSKNILCKEIGISTDEFCRISKMIINENSREFNTLSFMNHKLVKYLQSHKGVVDIFDKDIVSLYLKRTRHYHGFTLLEMSDYCEVSLPTYTNVEHAKRYTPRTFYTVMRALKEKDVLFPQNGLIL